MFTTDVHKGRSTDPTYRQRGDALMVLWAAEDVIEAAADDLDAICRDAEQGHP